MSKSRKTREQEVIVDNYIMELKKELGNGDVSQETFIKIIKKPMKWCQENFGNKSGTYYTYIISQLTKYMNTLK